MFKKKKKQYLCIQIVKKKEWYFNYRLPLFFYFLYNSVRALIIFILNSELIAILINVNLL